MAQKITKNLLVLVIAVVFGSALFEIVMRTFNPIPYHEVARWIAQDLRPESDL